MPIAFDAQAQAGNNDGSSILTYAHTCTGSSLVLFAEVATNFPQNSVMSVTYAGNTMSSVNAKVSTATTNIELFSLLNPPTGANNIVIRTSDAGANAKYAVSTSYSGVNNINAVSSIRTASSSILSQSITTVTDNSWIVWAWGTFPRQSDGANTTFRASDPNFGGAISDTGGAITPAGSTTMTTYLVGNSVSVGIQAAIAPLSTTKNLPLLGIGT